MATVIEKLVTSLAKIRLEKLKQELLLDVRYYLLDTIGCGLFGSTLPEGKKVTNVFSDFQHKKGSPVWGTSFSFSPEKTALICGTYCHLRELDDVHYSITHPGSVCVPAAFSVAYQKKRTLGDLLLATLCGVETMVRIAKGINYIEHSRRGWHTTATCGVFGAAMISGKLLNLNEMQMKNALGLAGTRTGGTRAYVTDGAMSKRLHPGLASRDGVLSAYLAEAGITGPSYILESEEGGFYKLTSKDWDINSVTEKIGENWAIEEMEYKWYPSCKSVHSPLEASKKINDLYKVKNIKDITKVLVEVSHSGLDAMKMYNSQSIISAQLSIPYGVALALTGRSGGIEDYTTKNLNDPDIYNLASKVEVKANVEFDILRAKEHKSRSRVTVFWNDGEKVTHVVDSPKGSIGNPLTKKDIEKKFIDLSSRALNEERIYQIKEMVTKAPISTPVEKISKLLVK